YGVWNYIKNSGNFPDAENLTLEWVGMIPGKRESRRFEGDYMLRQQDIVEQRIFEDAVAYGGWSIDLHPSDGVFSEKPGCNQWHSKGIYGIPYRCLYSKNRGNLFFSGRLISASHVAFGSTRVMGTSASVWQASGMAAVLCKQQGLLPRDLAGGNGLGLLQNALQRSGQYIPGLHLDDPSDLVREAVIAVSSRLVLDELPAHHWQTLELSMAQMLPLKAGKPPVLWMQVQAEVATEWQVELKVSSKAGNFTPDISLEQKVINLAAGLNKVKLDFAAEIPEEGYGFFCLYKNEKVKIAVRPKRVTGILSVFNLVNEAVSNYGRQVPVGDIGMDEFEFWCPQRRPEGLNLAMQIVPGLDVFREGNIRNGIARPTVRPNAWVADWNDAAPAIRLSWPDQKRIKKIILKFDTDTDHPMESVLMTHPESVMPFCVQNFVIYDGAGQVLHREEGNYQTIRIIGFSEPILTRELRVVLEHPSSDTPAAIFEILCYE
ncbi:MAG TPA: FAD-dependent oxidoreductase, partial [Puia sp.]|nr:FAD-dependent oxidoreductase [Puia sp.]